MNETANYDEMTTEQQEEAVNECLRDWGLEYTARQVPGKQDKESKNWQIAWKVGFKKTTIPNQGATMETDFYQGIGHHPKYNHRTFRLVINHDAIVGDAQRGTGGEKPTPAAVLSCLIMDARAGSQTFQSWADEFGCDTESRKAENIYKACQVIADELAKVFNGTKIEKLSAILAQY